MITRSPILTDLLETYRLRRTIEDDLRDTDITLFFDDMNITYLTDDMALDIPVLWDTIIEYSGECRPRYDDTRTLMRFSRAFFNRHKNEFIRYNSFLTKEYDPFNNVERYIEEDIKDGREIDTNSTLESNTEHTVSAYNSDDYSPQGNDEVNQRASANTSDDYGRDRDVYEHGLINKDRTELLQNAMNALRNNEDIYTYIAKKYSTEMCVEVY